MFVEINRPVTTQNFELRRRPTGGCTCRDHVTVPRDCLLRLQGLSSPAFHHERVRPQHQHRRPLQVLPDVREGLTPSPTAAAVPPLKLLGCDLCCRSHSTQLHLKNVYASLAACMLVAAAGAYVHVVTRLIQVKTAFWVPPALCVRSDRIRVLMLVLRAACCRPSAPWP